MDTKTLQENQRLINFWDQALALSEEILKQHLKSEQEKKR